MTLVALLVTMSVTCILLGMFIPLFVQGMVNIASGKSFDGSVNLSSRNGYFLCYFNNDGRLTQTRADVMPNGKDVEVVTALAAANNCRFDIPTWPESFKVTLIGGGGAGAIGDFSIIDEQVEDVTAKVIKPTVSGNNVVYNFDTDDVNGSMVSDFLNDSYICLAKGKAVRLENGESCADSKNTCRLTVDTSSKTISYQVAGRTSTARLSGTNILTDGDLNSENITACTDTPQFYRKLSSTSGVMIDWRNQITLSTRQSALILKSPKGGSTGEKVERVVPYFTDNGAGQLVISGDNLGKGGRRAVNSGRGGNTRLSLPGGTEIVANGGISGEVEENVYYDEGANAISAKEVAGDNGGIDRFIPAPLKITELRRGNGAIDVSVSGGRATYPGAGGGSGAVSLDAYNLGVVPEPCLTQRTQMSISGRAYELSCSPNEKAAVDIMERSGSGDGASGAILVAW